MGPEAETGVSPGDLRGGDPGDLRLLAGAMGECGDCKSRDVLCWCRAVWGVAEAYAVRIEEVDGDIGFVW